MERYAAKGLSGKKIFQLLIRDFLLIQSIYKFLV